MIDWLMLIEILMWFVIIDGLCFVLSKIWRKKDGSKKRRSTTGW